MNRIVGVCRISVLATVAGVALAPASLPALAQTAQNITCVAAGMTLTPSGTSNITVACTSPGGGPTAVCSLVAVASAPPLTSAGGPVTVTASNCASPLTWSRSPGPISPSATGTALTGGTMLNDNLGANSTTINVPYTYSVTDSLAATARSNPIVVPASGGTGGGTTSCGTPVTVGWGDLSHWYPPGGTSIPSGGSLAFQFMVPAAASGTANLELAITGTNNKVTWTLASSPCAIPNPDPGTGAVPFVNSKGYVWTIAIGGTGSAWVPAVQAGGTYFVNIKNTTGNAVTAYIEVAN